jgi:hypothetical protein
MFGEVGIDAVGQVGLPRFLKFGTRQVERGGGAFDNLEALRNEAAGPPPVIDAVRTPLRMPMLPTSTSP